MGRHQFMTDVGPNFITSALHESCQLVAFHISRHFLVGQLLAREKVREEKVGALRLRIGCHVACTANCCKGELLVLSHVASDLAGAAWERRKESEWGGVGEEVWP